MDAFSEDQLKKMKVRRLNQLCYSLILLKLDCMISCDGFAISNFSVPNSQLGGNAPFLDFLQNYSPAEAGGYSSSLSIHDKYHCWAAAQHREKVRQ
jgi:hypothetical protein